MDFGGAPRPRLLWLLFNLLTGREGQQPQRPVAPTADPGATTWQPAIPPSGRAAAWSAAPRAGAQPGGGRVGAGRPGRPASVPLPDAEEVEERESAGEPEPEVVSLEEGFGAPRERAGTTRTTERRAHRGSAGSRQPRRGDGALAPEADHAGVRSPGSARSRPTHTAVRRYTPEQLRDAIVWREILGPPVSERRVRTS